MGLLTSLTYQAPTASVTLTMPGKRASCLAHHTCTTQQHTSTCIQWPMTAPTMHVYRFLLGVLPQPPFFLMSHTVCQGCTCVDLLSVQWHSPAGAAVCYSLGWDWGVLLGWGLAGVVIVVTLQALAAAVSANMTAYWPTPLNHQGPAWTSQTHCTHNMNQLQKRW